MRIFTCSACQQMTFFENVQCTNCGRLLAYLPDHHVLSALERADGQTGELTSATPFVALAPSAKSGRYRLCENHTAHAACNWAIPEGDPNPLCPACRLNDVIPNLEKPEALEAWQKLERAKRRLIYTLMELGLPIESRDERPENGLAFSFMADGEGEKEKVFTGHADGLITININEADDPFRERVRKEMGEAYRTLLGHFRHEVGHYYWDRLVRDTPWLHHFRALFGDERVDYAAAMKQHYEQGAPPDWGQKFVSAYATMHPWEDWAETWSHYLHMVDTLGTARAFGLVLRAKPLGGTAEPTVAARALDFEDFDEMMTGWMPMTVALNSLNRSMGLVDPYPFVLSEKAITKLRFVHEVIEHWSASPRILEHVLSRWPALDPSTPPPTPPAPAPADASAATPPAASSNDGDAPAPATSATNEAAASPPQAAPAPATPATNEAAASPPQAAPAAEGPPPR